MEIIIKNIYQDVIRLSTNQMIGVMGIKRNKLLSLKNASIVSKWDLFYTNDIEKELYLYEKDTNKIMQVLNDFNYDENYLYQKINSLSIGDKHLLRYIIAILENKDVLIIDEPFQDLDYAMKKMIISLLKRMIYHEKKTIFLLSNDSDIIYELCQNTLIMRDNNYVYGKTLDLLNNQKILDEEKIMIPRIIEFINNVKNKNILINYSNDIRDLIKDVYKCV